MAGKTKPKQRGNAGGKLGGDIQGTGQVDACDLVIDTDLEGVRAEAVAGLKPGDPLLVELDLSARYPVVVCKRPNGTVVGSLAGFVSLTQLISCLRSGVQYSIAVTAVSSASCHVFGGRQ